MKLSSRLFIYGVAAAILALLFTHHERIGGALFVLALVPTYFVFFQAGKNLYDD
jgi:hypothetical protein